MCTNLVTFLVVCALQLHKAKSTKQQPTKQQQQQQQPATKPVRLARLVVSIVFGQQLTGLLGCVSSQPWLPYKQSWEEACIRHA